MRNCAPPRCLQQLEKEGGARREEFADLNRMKSEALREVNQQIAQFLLSERVVESFNSKFAVQVPAPGAPPPAPEVLLNIQLQIDELKSTKERLQTRCESDALFVALRSICTSNVWKPKDLAKQIVSGPSALKNAKDAKRGWHGYLMSSGSGETQLPCRCSCWPGSASEHRSM